MIFFLINNSYQLYDAKLHTSLTQTNKQRVDLIVIEHSISDPDYSNFGKVVEFPRFSYKSPIKSLIQSRHIKKKIDSDIAPTKNDVLFLYTEHDPFNQLVAILFKKSGAKVFLVEDGGFASYVPLCSERSESLSLKEKLKATIMRGLPELRNSRFYKVNGIPFPQMSEEYLDGVCLYRNARLHRKVKSFLVRRPVCNKIEKTNGSLIFLNEKIYGLYQAEESYMYYLDIILQELCSRFDIVYFKFHPRENDAHIQKISLKVLSKYPTIKIILEKKAIEELVYIYRPSHAASYFSAALLNLMDYGIEPLFVYPFVPPLVEQPSFKIVTMLLENWGYNFPSEFADMAPNFESGLSYGEGQLSRPSLLDLASS